MTHVRKDTLTKPPEWWKHLKWNKRVVSKAERKAAKKFIDGEIAIPQRIIFAKKPFEILT